MSFPLSRVFSAGPSRKTSIHLTPVNMKAAASLTRSPATSASSAASRSASQWAWPWIVSNSCILITPRIIYIYLFSIVSMCKHVSVVKRCLLALAFLQHHRKYACINMDRDIVDKCTAWLCNRVSKLILAFSSKHSSAYVVS